MTYIGDVFADDDLSTARTIIPPSEFIPSPIPSALDLCATCRERLSAQQELVVYDFSIRLASE